MLHASSSKPCPQFTVKPYHLTSMTASGIVYFKTNYEPGIADSEGLEEDPVVLLVSTPVPIRTRSVSARQTVLRLRHLSPMRFHRGPGSVLRILAIIIFVRE